MNETYQPGTVAQISWVTGRQELALIDNDGVWWTQKGVRVDHKYVKSVRRVLVIDPEDPEQVKRLLSALRDQGIAVAHAFAATPLTAALRELANPVTPKPAEPEGLGAVVEDAEGQRWIRTDFEQPAWSQWGHAIGRWNWSKITAVRVLSEGARP